MNNQLRALVKKTGVPTLIYKYYKRRGIGTVILEADPEPARLRLEQIRANAGKSCIRENSGTENEKLYDLDIIVPVYNTEKYVRRCIESVLKQKTNYSFRTIIVNDGSTDNSMELIAPMIQGRDNFTIVNRENGGLSVARNTGLDMVKAKYIMFVDADDCLDSMAVEKLLAKAFETDADVVEGAYEYMSEGMSLARKHVSHPAGRIPNFNQCYGMPWGKIYKAEMFNKIHFPEKYYFEDGLCKQVILTENTRIYGIDDTVYYYLINQNGISHRVENRGEAIDSYWVMEMLHEDRKKLGIPITRNYYEYIIKSVLLTMRRVRSFDITVQQDIFILLHCFLDNEFPDYCMEEGKYSDPEKALRTGDFGIFMKWLKYMY